MSDILVFVTEAPPVRGTSLCNGSECSSSFFDTALSLSSSDFHFPDPGIEYQSVSNHRGVSLAQGRGTAEIVGTSVDYFGYGGWLEHSFFVSESHVINGGLLQGAVFGYSYSLGNAAGTNPSVDGGSGTWTGVMVGGDVSATAARGHKIQGDAEITIADLADPKAIIAFTNIYDLDTRTVRADITWSEIPVMDGDFETGSGGDAIKGRFYGSNHEEVGGIFERDQILGAFGAVRQ